MKIAVIGTGYVGLVSGVCLAEFGFDVTCVDTNPQIIERLSRGEVTIFETGLESLLQSNLLAGRLSFTGDLSCAAATADVIFIAVGTPSDDTGGEADLGALMAAADAIAPVMKSGAVVVVKSTVTVGTCSIVREQLGRRHSRRIMRAYRQSCCQKRREDVERGRFAHIIGVSFVSNAENRNDLSAGLLHMSNNAPRHFQLSRLVHINDALNQPLRRAVTTSKRSKGTHILGKTRAANTRPGVEKLATDARVHTDGLGDILNIAVDFFAKVSDLIDEGHLHRQKRIGRVFDKFGVFKFREYYRHIL